MSATSEREHLLARGRRLEIFTVLWNSTEGIVSLAFGLLAGSIALVGFGLDSFIEMSSGLILLWRLQSRQDPAEGERAEVTALRLVGLSLLLLAGYLIADSLQALIAREAPQASLPGMGIAVLSLIVMPLLGRAKRRVASALHSHALEADALQTAICSYLSVILLGGLLLNALWGWWWADPLAALLMTPILVREGLEGLRGERCECAACGTPACTCAH